MKEADDDIVVAPMSLTDQSSISFKYKNRFITSLMIYNAFGQVMYQKQDMHENSFNLGAVIHVSGIYYFKIQSDQGLEISGKLVR